MLPPGLPGELGCLRQDCTPELVGDPSATPWQLLGSHELCAAELAQPGIARQPELLGSTEVIRFKIAASRMHKIRVAQK